MYYMMKTELADELLAMYPKAPRYDNDFFVLIGERPPNFEGTVVDLSLEGFSEDGSEDGLTGTQLNARVNIVKSNAPAGKLAILSKVQGRWLYDNRVGFRKEVGEIE